MWLPGRNCCCCIAPPATRHSWMPLAGWPICMRRSPWARPARAITAVAPARLAAPDLGGLHGCRAAVPGAARRNDRGGPLFRSGSRGNPGLCATVAGSRVRAISPWVRGSVRRQRTDLGARQRMGASRFARDLAPTSGCGSAPLGTERSVCSLLCSGLHRFQDRGGLWHTVIPEPATRTWNRRWPPWRPMPCGRRVPSPSWTARSSEKMEQAARTAVLGLVREDGSLGLVTDATPIGELAMYATRPFGTFPWGQGILLLLLTQP